MREDQDAAALMGVDILKYKLLAFAIVLIGIPEVLRAVAMYRMLAFGLLLILMMIFRPMGIFPSARRKLELKKEG